MMSKVSTQGPTRRKYLAAGTTAAAAFSIVPSYVVGASKTEKPPSEKLNVAGIGIGGMGKGNLGNCRGENIVALCDVHVAKEILAWLTPTVSAAPNICPGFS
jgi:hypothetical protein